ncbi:MAG: PHP domain-containing protein [Peptococcales bacterium]
MRYNNYHRHSIYSNVSTLDVITKPQDYIARIKELGHTTYSTCEHGFAGNYFEAYDLCKANGVKMLYVVEAYYVDDRTQKDNSNYHLILVAKNRSGFRQINKALSEANKTGFYYHPRLDLELLLALNPSDVFVTTACIGGRINGTDAEEKFVIPMHNHFKDHFFLEVQAHVDKNQAEHNQKLLALHQKYGIPLIHANDSHYIYPEQAKDRTLFLLGKGMNYGAEDNFVLDYPDYDTILERYQKQGILTREQAIDAIKNTLIFDQCEDMGFTKDIKMPSAYPGCDPNKKLREIINQRWQEERKHIPKERHKEYIEAIRYEVDIIEKTGMADYFLLDELIVRKAVNEYGAVLSRTGRGSGVSFYVNKLLGFTEVDRLDAEVPLYPTRFMSIARILESKSLPDLDINMADPEPVVKASKDILGVDNVYIMLAYGTMQHSAAFRNLCRAKNLQMDDYNEVAKNLEQYANHPEWKELIEESKKFIGVIDSVSPSPCSYLLLDKPISEEIGIMKIGDVFCACLDGYQADQQKYLKNDYLVVKVWDIISSTFKVIDKPIPNIRELRTLIDDRVWKLYEDGLTATLNQVDTDISTNLVKTYKPKSIAELTAFVAAIRPGFASLLQTFLHRQEYSTGIKELDEVLEDSFHFLLYQESIMKFLVWCGQPEDHTYDIIKKIAKKKFNEDEQEKLKTELLEGFVKNTGNENGFEEVWQVIEDAARYSFNASHALSVALDSIYGAYLKANYPLEYFTVALNKCADSSDKTTKITSELSSFNISMKPIKFRYSIADYSFDKVTNSIYKGIASIKFLNTRVAEELYTLRDNQYDSFIDLLVDIEEKLRVDTRQLRILTTLNFFSEFGQNQKLLSILDEFLNGKNKYYSTLKQKNKDKRLVFLRELEARLPDKAVSPQEQVLAEKEYLGFVTTKYCNAPDGYAIIVHTDNLYKPWIIAYHLKTGAEKKYKIEKWNYYDNNGEPRVSVGTMIDIKKIEAKPKWKKNDKVKGGFEMLDDTEEYIESFSIFKTN